MNKKQANYKQTEIGEIPEGWKVKKIEEVAKVEGGGTPLTSVPENFGGANPWITPRDLSNYENRYISQGERFLSDKGLRNSSAKMLPAGTVLLTTRAPVGYTAIAGKPVSTNQGFRSLIPQEGTTSEYLYYLLKNNKEVLVNNASGSTFQELSGGRLRKLEFLFPSKDEQQQIASILSPLDDKIELNRKINETLEEIGKALFKHWFVDFEFPSNEGRSYKSSGGEIVDSELGEIPKGWKVDKLGNHINIFDSKRIPLSSRERAKRRGDFPYYGATGIIDYVDDFIFDGIYLLIGEDGSVVKEDGFPFTQYIWGKFWVNNHAHVLQGKGNFPTEFIKLFLDITIITPYVTGAVQQKLNQANLKSIPFIVPGNNIIKAFREAIEPLFGLLRKHEDEIKGLSTVRDSLLPRLMSGRLRVN